VYQQRFPAFRYGGVDMTGDESGLNLQASRRIFLRNALLAGAGAAAVGITPLLGADAARAASATSDLGVKFGAMHSILPDWIAKAPSPFGKYSERRYFEAVNSIPKDWTAAACYSDYVTMSIRPNPDDLLHNKPVPDNGSGYTTLDDQIRHLISTCPDHAELTCWHEAQSNNPLRYPSFITKDSIPQIHEHVQRLCSTTPDADGGRVKYGCILTGPIKANTDWLGKDLDWYGVDIYDGPNFRYPNGNLNLDYLTARMDQNLKYWKTATKGPVSVRVTETNSAEDNHRKNWMLTLGQWMAANNGFRIITFWEGPDSGPWPPSKTVLDYYVTLQRRYGA
jgi:hypothetical protein